MASVYRTAELRGWIDPDGLEFATGSTAAFDGSKSRPNALMLTAATITLQAAKNSQPASERKESLNIVKLLQ